MRDMYDFFDDREVIAATVLLFLTAPVFQRSHMLAAGPGLEVALIAVAIKVCQSVFAWQEA